MKFAALVRKEFREALPFALILAILLLAIGGMYIHFQSMRVGMDFGRYDLKAGSVMHSYAFVAWSPFSSFGGWLLFVSIAAGIALGVRHFLLPYYTKTWPFLLHRSVSRHAILTAKLTAGALAFLILLGAAWSAMYWYFCRSEVSVIPPPSRQFVEGWIFILLGLIVYLGTALTGASPARWYTTKLFGLAFAGVVIVAVITEWRLSVAFAAIIIGAIILLVQIFHTFAEREF